MIGLLIVTHDTLGSAYEALVAHFFDTPPQNVRLLSVKKSDEPDDIRRRAHELADEVNSGNGVLILTDIFGATPCNVARKLIHQNDVGMITGLNAPMMVKAIQYAARKDDLNELMQEVKDAAIAGIMSFSFEEIEACA